MLVMTILMMVLVMVMLMVVMVVLIAMMTMLMPMTMTTMGAMNVWFDDISSGRSAIGDCYDGEYKLASTKLTSERSAMLC